MGSLPEGALVVLARNGDDAAFSELVKLRQGALRGLMRRWCGDPVLADDLAQEAFVQAWRKLNQLQSPAAFGGWLRQVAINVWLQHARRKQIQMDELPEDDSLFEARTDDTSGRLDLERALNGLRAPERLCIVLCHAEGMTHGEIADATGLPLGTVKSHVTRGVAKLRTLLEPDKVMS